MSLSNKSHGGSEEDNDEKNIEEEVSFGYRKVSFVYLVKLLFASSYKSAYHYSIHNKDNRNTKIKKHFLSAQNDGK